MVAFASLILSLVVGLQPVELLVGDGVAHVELRLNGEVVAVVVGPPWSAVCDLGEELAPRRLEAVAFDVGGFEVDRAEQWLNLPRPAAEVSVLIEGGGNGRDAVARVAWRNLFGRPPIRVKATLDGRRVEVDDPRRIALPRFNPSALHILEVDLLFPEGLVSSAEVTFGGVFGEETSSELTAVPIVLQKGRPLPSLDDLAGWLRLDSGASEVLAVEEGPIEVVMVVSEAARQVLARLIAEVKVKGRRLGPLRERARLDREHRLRFVDTRPLDLVDRELPVRIFPDSQVFERRDGGLLWLLDNVRPARKRPGAERLTDAVAAAALAAARKNRRRAVVLMTGPGGADASLFDVDRVRRYFQRVRVPLVVWRVGGHGPGDPRWPADEVVGTHWELAAAYRRLTRRLDRQRLVWLRGAHLPHQIELVPTARGLHLAGVDGNEVVGAAAGGVGAAAK